MIAAALCLLLAEAPDASLGAPPPTRPAVSVSVDGCAREDTSELLRLLTFEVRDADAWQGASAVEIACRGGQAVVSARGEGRRTSSAPLRLDDKMPAQARAARLRELVLLSRELLRLLARVAPETPAGSAAAVAAAASPSASESGLAAASGPAERPPWLGIGVLASGAAYAGGVMHAGPELVVGATVAPRWRVEARMAFRWGISETSAHGEIAHRALGGSLGAALRPFVMVRGMSVDLGARLDFQQVLAEGRTPAGDSYPEGRADTRLALLLIAGPSVRKALGPSLSLVGELSYAQPLVPVALRDSGANVAALSGPGLLIALGLERVF